MRGEPAGHGGGGGGVEPCAVGRSRACSAARGSAKPPLGRWSLQRAWAGRQGAPAGRGRLRRRAGACAGLKELSGALAVMWKSGFERPQRHSKTQGWPLRWRRRFAPLTTTERVRLPCPLQPDPQTCRKRLYTCMRCFRDRHMHHAGTLLHPQARGPVAAAVAAACRLPLPTHCPAPLRTSLAGGIGLRQLDAFRAGRSSCASGRRLHAAG